MFLELKINELIENNKTVRVALIGAGKFGSMFLSQVPSTKGLSVSSICDLNVEKAKQSCREVGWSEDLILNTNFLDNSEEAINRDDVDVVVEATGHPGHGISHARKCFQYGKHVIMVNVEADVLAGAYLSKEAKSANVVYSMAYGDQPALTIEIIEWARASGFNVTAAGKGTKYLPEFHASTPDTVWNYYGLNTSYLNVDEIAEVVSNPERVIGLHFFSPANIMKLLEIVVAEKTSSDTVATAFSLAKAMKKIPVRSGVCDGFIGNRILSKYLVATYHMVEDGASIFDIDRVIRDFGCAMGPFQVIDLAGGDIGWATRKRKAPSRNKDDRYVEIPDRVCEKGWFGQKTGKGYYLYGKDVPFLTPNPEIDQICNEERKRAGINSKEFTDQEILDKYISSLVLEGIKILEEKISLRPSDIDVVYINGYGFPRWRGGPMNYADSIGLDKVLNNIKNYEKEDPRFWKCPDLLLKLVSEKKSFKDLN